ncbi:MAG: 2OG-Fe(II) oxygenase [Legionellales bacterium]|nr:2OG-Fe(II) oxygenase [Legionellales bacterium]
MYVKKVDFTSSDAAKIFCESLKDTGFAVVTNHPINMALVDQVFAAWKDFFASDEKYQYKFNPDNQAGFFPLDISEKAKGAEVIDIKEFFQFYPWCDAPEALKQLTQQLYDAMQTMASTLLNWIEQGTPAEISAQYSMPLSKMLETSKRTMLRILNYPALKGDEADGAIRAADHEDINLITLLPAATAPGLQVKDVHGNWHDVPCDPGNIAVNSGDMLEECSQGYYKATTHRVCNPVGDAAKEARLSMPLFLHAGDEVHLSSRHTAKSYLEERLRELGVLAEDKSLT